MYLFNTKGAKVSVDKDQFDILIDAGWTKEAPTEKPVKEVKVEAPPEKPKVEAEPEAEKPKVEAEPEAEKPAKAPSKPKAKKIVKKSA